MPPMWLRKLIRPLIPNRVMARYRLHQHSRQVRTNVDVFLPDDAKAARRRWLLATPDTYRVRPISSLGPAPPFRSVDPAGGRVTAGEVVAIGSHDDAPTAARLLADEALAAAAVGEVAGPRLAGRRRVEPPVGLRAVAVRGEWWAEVGGAPAGDGAALPAVWDRLRAAGLPLGLAPVAPAGAPTARSDRIAEPAVVVFSLVPMHDVGGGSRGAQFAIELVRRGYHVTHAALYGTAETVDLGLRYLHPRLEQVRFGEFEPRRYLGRLAPDVPEPPLVIVEMPAEALLEAVGALRAGGATVVYDLIDDWSAPSLGGDWYRPGAEAEVVAASDALMASAPDLVTALGRFGRPVALVPNGVNAELFAGPPGDPPPDFPPGDGPVLGYHGTLHGDWFDWEAVAGLAHARPQARVLMIGDDKGARPGMPPNVHFLGLKPQFALPGYVALFDVGLVPFAVSDLTHAVSPLKTFEYLAAGVPVAAAPLRALAGIAGVHTDADLGAAVDAALAAPRPDGEEARRAHSWGARLETVLAAAGRALAPVAGPGPAIEVRPAVHYPGPERSPGW